MTPEEILTTYDRIAARFDAERDRTLFERRYLDIMLNHTQPGPNGRRHVLDLGCGSGRPIARYLSDRRAEVTGVDGAAAMIDLFRQNVPAAEAIRADMRGLDLAREFGAVLAWNSFFHLSPADQRGAFAVFGRHTCPGGVLMFTAGHKAGEPIGEAGGAAVYHASLSHGEYQDLLALHGFEMLLYAPQAADCRGHTIYLARKALTS